MNFRRLCLLFSLAILPGGLISADLTEQAASCDECHGPLGVSKAKDVPTIAGQPSNYIEATMRVYQQWGRPCIKTAWRDGDLSRPATTMCKISEALTYDEIEALGKYYESQQFVAAKQPFDPALAEIGGDLHEINCESCHAMGGSIAARGPRLGGQWAPYLRTAITQALSGEHLVPPVMEKRLGEFGPEDIDSLVNFYASQQ
jgi:cytochrome c553